MLQGRFPPVAEEGIWVYGMLSIPFHSLSTGERHEMAFELLSGIV